MSYYRRSAVLKVGGFNEELNVMEHTDLQWKLEKAGYVADVDPKRALANVAHIHHRLIYRFTLSFVLRNAFTYGRDWHKLYHMHPDKVGISAIPVKIAVFATMVFISYFYPPTLWVLFISMLLWFTFRFFRDRVRVRNCVAHMEGIFEKIVALTFVFLLHILSEISQELGKLYGMISYKRK